MTSLIQLTWDLESVARDLFGHGQVGNRSIQMVLLLHGSPGLSPSAAAEALGIPRSAVSRVLNRLESDGLVDRRVDQTDHRVVKIQLTVGALGLVEDFEERLSEMLVDLAPMLRELAGMLGVESASPEPSPSTGLQAAFGMARAGATFIEDIQPMMLRYGVREVRDRFLLALLHDRGPLRPIELARDLEVTSGGVNAVLERLEGAGLVSRAASPHLDDGRAVLVHLTPRGREASELALRSLERHARHLGESIISASRLTKPDTVAEVAFRMQLS
ncbi:MAG: MarR family transcriptional regulator [Propionicimonas sp.]